MKFDHVHLFYVTNTADNTNSFLVKNESLNNYFK